MNEHEKQPQNVQEFYQKGLEFKNRGELLEAIDCFKRVLLDELMRIKGIKMILEIYNSMERSNDNIIKIKFYGEELSKEYRKKGYLNESHKIDNFLKSLPTVQRKIISSYDIKATPYMKDGQLSQEDSTRVNIPQDTINLMKNSSQVEKSEQEIGHMYDTAYYNIIISKIFEVSQKYAVIAILIRELYYNMRDAEKLVNQDKIILEEKLDFDKAIEIKNKLVNIGVTAEIQKVGTNIVDNKASFIKRFLAFNVDIILLSIIGIFIFILMMIGGIIGYKVTSLENTTSQIIVLLILFTPFSYFAYFHYANGMTIGKKLFNIQVKNIDNTKITFGESITRTICYFISTFFWGLGFLWMLWDKNKQTWHDKICGTYVEDQNKEYKEGLLAAISLSGAGIGIFAGLLILWGTIELVGGGGDLGLAALALPFYAAFIGAWFGLVIFGVIGHKILVKTRIRQKYKAISREEVIYKIMLFDNDKEPGRITQLAEYLRGRLRLPVAIIKPKLYSQYDPIIISEGLNKEQAEKIKTEILAIDLLSKVEIVKDVELKYKDTIALSSLILRGIAFLIDFVIIMFISSAIFFISLGGSAFLLAPLLAYLFGSGEHIDTMIAIITILLMQLPFIVYFLYFYATTGETIGKKIFGFKVQRLDKTKLKLKNSAIRVLGYLIPQWVFILIIVVSSNISKLINQNMPVIHGIYTLIFLIIFNIIWYIFRGNLFHDDLAKTKVIRKS